MKRKYNNDICIFFILFCFTAILFVLKPETEANNVSKTLLDNYVLFKTNFSFYNIFFTNLIVGLMIVYGGFFTFGLLSIAIWFWNIIIVYLIYSNIQYTDEHFYNVLYYSKHFFFELYGFVLFTKISLRSTKFIKAIYLNNEVIFDLKPKLHELIYPIFILFISSIIEVL